MNRNEQIYTEAHSELAAALRHLRNANLALDQTVGAPESLNRFSIGGAATMIEMLVDVLCRAQHDEVDQ